MQEWEMNRTPPQQKRRYTPEQRAAILRAREKRRAERRRNRIIALAICAVVLVLLLVGIVKLALFAFSALHALEWPSFDVLSDSAVTTQATVQDDDLMDDLGSAQEEEVEEIVSYDLSDYSYNPDDARLVLVNANLPLAESYTVSTAVADDATGVCLESEAATSYRAMASAASADGILLVLSAGYLDADGQQELFEEWQAFYREEGYSEDDALAYAQTVVGGVSTSEYQTGYGAAILSADYTTWDTGFEETDAFAWLETYAAEYGFILRYPEDKQMITGKTYQPWHWRYVGVENAKAIVTSGLSLEEFIEVDGEF